MFSKKQAPELQRSVEHREWTVYTFRKRKFKKLMGIAADRRGVADVDVARGVVTIRMYGDHTARGTHRESDTTKYTLSADAFKARLGITAPRDVLMVSTGGALSSSVEITMSRQDGG